uniref:Nonstructural protein 5 n=1 Tax=Porcine rotavirus B TaxID=449582 RepID=K4Q0N0_9REOV|nr:nonstructural protein 5 [Porcine rotavirus B]BAM65592.1 nonstructural protein 5 [Porcine rotavirus B]
MAEASEFNFNIRRKKRTVSEKRETKEVVKSKMPVEEKSENYEEVESASVYSQESSRSNYSDAYEKLKREPMVEDSNDERYKTLEYSEDEEIFKSTPKRGDKLTQSASRTQHEDNGDSSTIMEKISELSLEIEKVKQQHQPLTVDSAFNMTLRNVDNLTTRQKQALVVALVNSMN